ncbi:MAG TPA: hypothetical protein VHU40_18530 [Polyangia bacterium]|nr:hypothetical protein [Polyangia bacterium]
MTKQAMTIGLGALMLLGCGGDLPEATRLERTRVLGARVKVAADPGRADAQAGEAATVEWILAAPRAPGALAWSFGLCTAIDGTCEGATAMAAEGNGAPVMVPFTMPSPIDDVRRPLMLGAICEGGAPGVGGDGLPTCGAGTTSANVARFQLPDATGNRHPQFGDDAIEFEGTPWTAHATGDAGAPCDEASGLPVVTADVDKEHRFRVITDANDRESYTPAGATAPALEALQMSSFSTEGELSGQYTAVEPTDTRPDADLSGKWTTPAAKDVPPAGLTVHFHFVLRDGRGGLDITDRALCVRTP